MTHLIISKETPCKKILKTSRWKEHVTYKKKKRNKKNKEDREVGWERGSKWKGKGGGRGRCGNKYKD